MIPITISEDITMWVNISQLMAIKCPKKWWFVILCNNSIVSDRRDCVDAVSPLSVV